MKQPTAIARLRETAAPKVSDFKKAIKAKWPKAQLDIQDDYVRVRRIPNEPSDAAAMNALGKKFGLKWDGWDEDGNGCWIV